MKKQLSRHAGGRVALMALGLGCGADSVDVGDRPVNGDGPPDGGSFVDGSTRCNIPDRGQYRLLFDSDGGRLERRIYSMRADGTEIEALTPPGELAREPALSPDGTQLAYVTPEGIRLLQLASGASELLIGGGDQPMWAPDGSSLIYQHAGCIERMSMADRAPVREFCTPSVGFDVTPDGNSFVYIVTTDFTGVEFGYELTSTRPEDSQRQTVPRTPVEMTYPTVSPDAVWVAASYRCGGEEPSLWASPLDVSTPACEGRRISPAGTPSAINAEWGPGTLIAYERAEPPRDIAIIAADTGEECVIEGPGDDRNPTWGVFTTVVPE